MRRLSSLTALAIILGLSLGLSTSAAFAFPPGPPDDVPPLPLDWKLDFPEGPPFPMDPPKPQETAGWDPGDGRPPWARGRDKGASP